MRAPALCALLFLGMTWPALAQDTPPPPPEPPAPAPPVPAPPEPTPAPEPAPGEPAPEAPPEPGAPLQPEALPPPTSSDATSPEALQQFEPTPATPPAAGPEAAGPQAGGPEAGGPLAGGAAGRAGAVSGGWIGAGAGPGQNPGDALTPLIDPLEPVDLTLQPDAAALDPRAAAAAEEPSALSGGATEPGRDLRERRNVPMGRSELSRGTALDAFGLAPLEEEERGLRLNRWLVLSPRVRLSAFYDSNLFRARDNDPTQEVESDVELTASIGFELIARPMRELFLSCSYAALFRTFVKEASVNSGDHFLRLSGSWQGPRLGYGGTLSIARLSRPDDPRFDTAQVERTTLEGNSNIQWMFTRRVGVRLETASEYTAYDDLNELDQVGIGGNVFLTWQVNRVLALLAGGGVRELRYIDKDATSPDLRLYSPVTGAEVRLSSRLSFSLRLGYEVGEFTNDRDQTNLDEPEGVVASLGCTWIINPRWRLLASGSRQTSFGVTSTTAFQTVSRFSLELRRRLGPRVEAWARGSAELQDSQQRDDLLALTAEGGVDWRPLDWLLVGFAASYLDSSSDQRGDYDVFRLGVSLTFTP